MGSEFDPKEVIRDMELCLSGIVGIHFGAVKANQSDVGKKIYCNESKATVV